MSFGKFHESEGLAAISRALKAKKEVPEQKVRKHDNGSTPAGGSVQKVIQEKGADEGKKKKKKKRQHSAEPQDAHESAEALDSRVQKKDKKTKKSKEKETAVADTVRDKEESPGAKKDKPSKKAKKGKEGKCSKGSGSAAENGNESAAVTEKGGCVCRYPLCWCQLPLLPCCYVLGQHCGDRVDVSSMHVYVCRQACSACARSQATHRGFVIRRGS